MRKILFVLFATVLLLVSCDDKNSVEEGEKYKVSFSVSFPENGFGMINSALPEGNYCQYVIYKENGDVYTTKIMEAGTFDVQNIRITEYIPYGKYHIAVISAKKTANGNLTFEPSRYDTDCCDGNQWTTKGRDNQNIYFETESFDFKEQISTDIADIQLKPTWSYVYLRIYDADVCYLPEGTTHVQCIIDPYYYGFNIKDKRPVQCYEQAASLTGSDLPLTVTEFRDKKAINDIVVSESQNVVFKLVFIRHSATESATILGEKVIYTADIKNGDYISLTGKLGNEGEPAEFDDSEQPVY